MIWTAKCSNCQSHRVLISDIKSNWRPVIGGVHWGSVLGPMLFNVFIYDIDNGKVHSKFKDDTKPGQVTDRSDECSVILRDHNRLDKWDNNELIQF